MGWWNSGKDGSSFEFDDPNHFWGDGPADIMDSALRQITVWFEDEFDRPPTLSELISGLKFSAIDFK